MTHILNSHVELEADRDGWHQVYVIETDVELDSADDHYDAGAVEALMGELLDLQSILHFSCFRVRTREDAAVGTVAWPHRRAATAHH